MDVSAIRRAANLAREAGDTATADDLDAFALKMETDENAPPASGRTTPAAPTTPDEPAPAEYAAAQVAVIEAQTASEIALMNAAAKIRTTEIRATGGESEGDDEGENVGESEGDDAGEGDPAPKVEHWFYRPLR